MAINKVEYGQKTLIDLTSDTVTKKTLVKGTSAHNAAGEQIEGVFDPDVYLKKSGGDAKDVVSTFSSSDTDDSVSEWTSVSMLSSGEKLSSLFNKISTMFRNIRYLYKLIGSTDISELSEDGTITKSLTILNSNLTKVIQMKAFDITFENGVSITSITGSTYNGYPLTIIPIGQAFGCTLYVSNLSPYTVVAKADITFTGIATCYIIYTNINIV